MRAIKARYAEQGAHEEAKLGVGSPVLRGIVRVCSSCHMRRMAHISTCGSCDCFLFFEKVTTISAEHMHWWESRGHAPAEPQETT